MESLNLNTLANSLPPSNLVNAEKDLMDKFKAAALSITTFYRSSRRTSKKAYNAGYAAACQDLLSMIQQGVSDSQHQEGVGGDAIGMEMTIGRIMDWVEARLEAVKAREEEEDEDEERGRAGTAATAVATEGHRTGGSSSGHATSSSTGTANSTKNTGGKSAQSSSSPSKDQHQPTSSTHATLPLTPHSPHTSNTNWRLPSSPTPSPPSSRLPLPPPTPLGTSNMNHSKLRVLSHSNPKMVSPSLSATTDVTNFHDSPFMFGRATGGSFGVGNSGDTAVLSPLDVSAGAGTKRRHDLMMVLNSSNTGSPSNSHVAPTSHPSVNASSAHEMGPAGGTRRRTRSTRASAASGNVGGGSAAVSERERERDGNAMDVDERERKRVARR